MIAGGCLIYAGKGEWCGEEGDGDGQNARNRLFSLICSRFLLFSRVCSHFLLLSLVCTMGNSPADFNMSLRLTLAIPRAGVLFCVPAVYFGNFPRRLFGRWPRQRGAAEIGPLCMTGERWGVAEKQPPPSLGRVGLFLRIHQTLPRAGVAEKQGMAFRGLCPEFLSGAYEGHGKA